MTTSKLFGQVKNKIGNLKKYSISDLPDRTKIFLSAMLFWAYMAFYFNKLIGCMLGFILTHTPDKYIIYNPKLPKKTVKTLEIIEAKLGPDTITNKLKLLVNSHWDDDILDFGGVNVKDLVSNYPALSTSLIWVCYILEMDEKIKSMSDEEIGKSVKHMLINISDKSVYRKSTLEDAEELLFGEIPF